MLKMNLETSINNINYLRYMQDQAQQPPQEQGKTNAAADCYCREGRPPQGTFREQKK